MTKSATKTLDATKVRQIESLSWGGAIAVPRLRVATAVKASTALGIAWPTDTAEQVDAIAAALVTVTHLHAERPRLTLDDLLADDAPGRARAAISIDEGGTRYATPAQQELLAAGINATTSAITSAAPDILNKVADWITEHADQRHLAKYARDLPAPVAAKVGQWDTAVQAHSELLRITDPMTFEDLERNEEAHRLYAWTDQQWIAFHTAQDTLNTDKQTAQWWDWKGLADVEVKPARTTTEVARRAKHANDIATAWNDEHRPKLNLRWY